MGFTKATGIGGEEINTGVQLYWKRFLLKLSGGYGSGCIILSTFLNESNIHSETL